MLSHYHGRLVFVEQTEAHSGLCRVLILETYSRVLVRADDLEA